MRGTFLDPWIAGLICVNYWRHPFPIFMSFNFANTINDGNFLKACLLFERCMDTRSQVLCVLILITYFLMLLLIMQKIHRYSYSICVFQFS